MKEYITARRSMLHRTNAAVEPYEKPNKEPKISSSVCQHSFSRFWKSKLSRCHKVFDESDATVSVIKTINHVYTSYLPVLARFIPVLLNGDMLGLILGLILGLSSLNVPFSIANSLSCCFL